MAGTEQQQLEEYVQQQACCSEDFAASEADQYVSAARAIPAYAESPDDESSCKSAPARYGHGRQAPLGLILK